MALIGPTVETIGDEALTTSIIDRSITELQDNLVVNVAENALRQCTSLKKVVFGSANKLGSSALGSCVSLETADFHARCEFSSLAFNGCSSLKSLILRSQTMCTLANTNALQGTAIANGTGYIYVPRSLISNYLALSSWKTYQNQIRAIEDYPEMCSTAGKIWRTSNITNKTAYSLGYANGLWLASGHYSKDGKTWTASSKVPARFSYGNGLWVGNSSSQMSYSTDGITWINGETVGVSNTQPLFEGGLWFLISPGKTPLWSEDGMTWASNSAPTNAVGLAYGNGVWVTTDGYNGTGVHRSENGSTWEFISVCAGLDKVNFCRDAFFASGADKKTGLWRSEDGATWTNVFAGRSYTTTYVAYGNGIYVATCGKNVYYSQDGITWANAEPFDNFTAGALVFFDGVFYAGASNGSSEARYSTDGITWRETRGLSRPRRVVVCHDGTWVGVDASSSGFQYSE